MFESSLEIFSIILYITLIYCSIAVIYSSSPVYSICYLIASFAISAILILFMGAQLLSIIFIMIYIGAILVLFVFIIMMLDIKKMEIYIPFNRSLSNGVAALIGFLLYYNIWSNFKNFFINNILFNIEIQKNSYNNYIPWTGSNNILKKMSNTVSLKKNIQYYSDILYIDHFLMFWIGGMLLLLAMVGAIIISLNKTITIYRQNSFSQINKNEKYSLFLFKKGINKRIWSNWIKTKLIKKNDE